MRAKRLGMHATCVEDLQVFQRARKLMLEVFSLTSGIGSDLWLRGQLDESVESAAANIAEGFVQGSDRAFARYLRISAGSLEELRLHLDAAKAKELLPANRANELIGEAREIGNMVGALIRHLKRCDRKDRSS